MAISQELGQEREARLPQGTIRYRERGTGEPIVFVHGALVNGDLWRKVVPELAKDFRCITPDWPLGSHSVAMNADADLTPSGNAQVIADFLQALDLDRVTLVGNDTGGALCQLVVTQHPERVGRLVLTNCDAYENFPPRIFAFLFYGAKVPGFVRMLGQPMRFAPMRKLPIAFGWLSKRGIPDDISGAWLRPSLKDAGVRRDITKLLRAVKKSELVDASKHFKEFDKPVLLAWGTEKDFFRVSDAEQLARDFPNARLEKIDDSYTYVSEDQPERLSKLIAEFAREPAAATA
jgi:pimeloyl-ACP methyl ester carboxylesterase